MLHNPQLLCGVLYDLFDLGVEQLGQVPHPTILQQQIDVILQKINRHYLIVLDPYSMALRIRILFQNTDSEKIALKTGWPEPPIFENSGSGSSSSSRQIPAPAPAPTPTPTLVIVVIVIVVIVIVVIVIVVIVIVKS